MLSIFNRVIQPKAKPDISLFGDCQSYSIYSSTHHLSNGLILSIGRYNPDDKNKINQTEVVLFDPRTNAKVAETVLSESYRVASNVFDDNKLLLRAERKHIAIFDCNILKVIDTMVNEVDEYAQWLALGNQRFVTIERPHYNNKNTAFRLVTHDLAARKFNQPASLSLPINEEEAVSMGHRYYISVDHLSQLANGQFACLVRGHNTGYYEVILFDRTPGAEYEFQIAGVIKPAPESWCHDDNSTPYVDYVGLPNGDILTYPHSGQHLQIWHGTKCIDNWSWHQDVKSNDNVFNRGFWTFQVTPLPDGEHLLINSKVKLFLFNIQTREIKPVELGKFTPDDVSLSPEGKIIVRAEEKLHPYKLNNRLLVVDLHQMLVKNTEKKMVNAKPNIS